MAFISANFDVSISCSSISVFKGIVYDVVKVMVTLEDLYGVNEESSWWGAWGVVAPLAHVVRSILVFPCFGVTQWGKRLWAGGLGSLRPPSLKSHIGDPPHGDGALGKSGVFLFPGPVCMAPPFGGEGFGTGLIFVPP